jgi:integrase
MMYQDRAGLSSPGPSNTVPAMGRKRTTHHDLPPRMARKGASFYYVSNGKPRTWTPLGTDRARALRRWAEIEGGQSGLSVGDLVQRYIDRSDDLADGTRKQYQSYHRAIAAAFPIPAAQLTSQIVALWRDLPAQRQRKTYVNGCLAVLRAAYLLGGEQGLATPLSVRGWTLKARDRYLEDAEFRAIRERAPEWLQVAMDLAYVTAARRSDVLACQWSHCSPDGVAMRQQKTGQRISFTVTPELSSILARARQRRVIGLYVVANTKGRPISRTALEYAWGIACKAAGVVAQFRDIRAKAATDAKSGGQDYQKLLGHANAAMSERYIKRRETTIAEPVRRKL